MGFRYAMIYHPGSILRGAMVIPTWRPWRVIYWITAELSADGQPSTTFFGKALDLLSTLTCTFCGLKGCCGLKARAKGVIEQNNCAVKDAFCDVAIRANDFDTASGKAHDFLEHSHKIVQLLYRDLSSTTVNMIGVGSISTMSAIIVYLLAINIPAYADPLSTLYLADPFLITFLAWILSAYIAFGFMMLWDHTADSLLYCYAWSRRWDRKNVDKYIPEFLRAIIGGDDKENDRYPYYGKAKNNMYLRFWLPMVGMEAPAAGAAPPAKKAAEPIQADAQASWFSQGWGRQEGGAGSMIRQDVGEQRPLLNA